MSNSPVRTTCRTGCLEHSPLCCYTHRDAHESVCLSSSCLFCGSCCPAGGGGGGSPCLLADPSPVSYYIVRTRVLRVIACLVPGWLAGGPGGRWVRGTRVGPLDTAAGDIPELMACEGLRGAWIEREREHGAPVRLALAWVGAGCRWLVIRSPAQLSLQR